MTEEKTTLKQRLLIWIDKKRWGSSICEATKGKFRVEYFNGDITRPMYWENAVEYAKIFGGYIYHIPTGKKIDAYYSLDDLVN